MIPDAYEVFYLRLMHQFPQFRHQDGDATVEEIINYITHLRNELELK